MENTGTFEILKINDSIWGAVICNPSMYIITENSYTQDGIVINKDYVCGFFNDDTVVYSESYYDEY